MGVSFLKQPGGETGARKYGARELPPVRERSLPIPSLKGVHFSRLQPSPSASESINNDRSPLYCCIGSRGGPAVVSINPLLRIFWRWCQHRQEINQHDLDVQE